MLIFPGSNGDVNVLHIVIGPESQMHFDLIGHYNIDIKPIIQAFPNQDLPLKLLVTRSNGEKDTIHAMNSLGIQHPMPLYLARPGFLENWADTENDDSSHPISDEFGRFEPEVICPKCQTKGVWIKDGQQALCSDCIRIENGRGDSDQNARE